MADLPKDGFPIFQDGDVEIRLSRKPEDRFVLHSFVLGLHSPFFKASISERWSGQNDDATTGDPIKWKYQLLFEEDMNVAPLLAKAKPEAFSVPRPANVSRQTASLYIMQAPYVPSTNSKTRTRLTSIRAHRHYLETLYHKPLNLATVKFPGLVDSLVRVLRLADAYGSLAIFQMPVDTAFARLKSDLDELCGKYYSEIIHIATLARSAWLFQYVICRLVGDPTWADERIRKTFDTLGVTTLVLEKRSQLRETMLRLDHDIMLVGVPVSEYCSGLHGHTAALATAAYHLRLIGLIKDYNRGGWRFSSEKYRFLKDEGEGESCPAGCYDKLLSRFGPIKVQKSDFEAVIDNLRTTVARYVSPLLVDHVGVDRTIPSPEDGNRAEHGLTCVKITDDDLPWKDIPW